MTKPGLAELFNRIRGVMLRDRCPEDRALAVVFAEIRSDPVQLQRWWDALGDFWLQATVAYVWDHGGPDKLNIRMKGLPELPPLPAEPELQPVVTVQGRRWRERVGPLDMLVPIGGTKKRLGDLVREDVRELADHYRAAGQKLLQEGERWKGVAEQMRAGERLEDLVGRLETRDGLPKKLASLPVSEETAGRSVV
jgi:hypothetical protein